MMSTRMSCSYQELATMRSNYKELAKLKLKPEVKELLCPDFLDYLYGPLDVFEVRGGPLLDLFSVQVTPKTDPHDVHGETNWKVTATITAADQQDDVFTVIKLLPCNPLSISDPASNGRPPLSTGIPTFPVSFFFPSFHAHVHVKDLVRDRVLIDAPLFLDFKDFKQFDQVQSTKVEGGDGTILHLKYIAYEAAVVALPSLRVITNTNVVGGIANDQVMVSGTVFGSCHYDLSDICVDPPFHKPNSVCVTLFDSSCGVPVTLGVPVNRGDRMGLNMPYMAVPSYSYLALHINLNIAGFGSFTKIVILRAAHHYSRVVSMEGPQSLIIEMKVDCKHACTVHFDPTVVGGISDDKEAQVLLPAEPTEAMVAIDEEPQTPSFYLYKYWQVPRFRGNTLMEVFTAHIIPKNDEPCKIHGKIEVYDALRNDWVFDDPDNTNDALREDCVIYDHDNTNAEEICGNNRTISLRGPRDNMFAFEWNELGMRIDLKSGDRQFCRGKINWTVIAIGEPWLDNHMCSVIKGDLGYAAVYYGIFPNAVQARLRVYVLSSDADVYVSGSIFGEHGNFDYVTHFERECYRSVIFSKSEEKAQVLSLVDEEAMPFSPYCFKSERSKLLKVSGIELPLLKSLVLVPNETFLVLELDLSVKIRINGSNVSVAFKNRAEFKVDHQTCWVASNKGCQICVFVDWDTVFK